MANDFKFEDNSDKVITELEQIEIKALTKMGMLIQGAAKKEVRYDTGKTRDSIDYKVNSLAMEVQIGTPDLLGLYHEFGTGEHAENGQGRKGYWVYVPGSSSVVGGTKKIYTLQQAKQIMAILQSKGIDAHITNGLKPKPFLRPAFRNHKKNVQKILADLLGGKFK